MFRRARNQRVAGLTLLEVVVATTVLTVGILGTMACFSVSLKAAGRARASEQAVILAQQKLTDAMCMPVEEIHPAKGMSGRYQWQVRRRDLPYDLVSVSVEVDWLEQGEVRQLRLARVIMPEPPGEEPEQ